MVFYHMCGDDSIFVVKDSNVEFSGVERVEGGRYDGISPWGHGVSPEYLLLVPE